MRGSLVRRGHFGGLLGGALAAYLLGPCYKLVKSSMKDGLVYRDRPPLPIFVRAT
jgi:hypothetical protein